MSARSRGRNKTTTEQQDRDRAEERLPDDDWVQVPDIVRVVDQKGVQKRDPHASGGDDHHGRGLRGDEVNFAVLLSLYVLQGIPLGLAAAVPLILTARHVSYKEQAEFSLSYWPFAMKLLWAPMVDACFLPRFGRRKTWLVPVQYLIGMTMLIMSGNVKYYLGEEDGGLDRPNVFALSSMFFFLNFLAATQDITVDGWALTMLQRHNIGYASTCNSVGQTTGYVLGYVVYIVLESYELITLSGFLSFWGITFMVATTLVAFFKHEKPDNADFHDEHDRGIVKTYQLLYKIIRLPLMPTLILVLLTCKVGFSATDAVAYLKFIEHGVPRETLMLPMIPIQILLPLIISRYTAGPTPMNIFLNVIPVRLIVGLVMAWTVSITPTFRMDDGQFQFSFFVIVATINAFNQICLYSMFVSVMAFFARISDAAVGGTYMTLLNTLVNLAGNWSSTLALWFVDFLTERECVGADVSKLEEDNFCVGPLQVDQCEKVAGGRCETIIDGYYVETMICFVIGSAWLLWGWRTIKQLQDADVSNWHVVKEKQSKS